jgi:hypothetical protein
MVHEVLSIGLWKSFRDYFVVLLVNGVVNGFAGSLWLLLLEAFYLKRVLWWWHQVSKWQFLEDFN